MNILKISTYILSLSFLFLGCNNNRNENHTVTNSELKYDVIVALVFINSYIKNTEHFESQDDITKWIDGNAYVTKSFKAEYKKITRQAGEDDPEMGLGFDHVLDAQDYPEEGFELESSDFKTGYIVCRGKNMKDVKLTIKIILQNGKWLVDGCGIINIPFNKRQPR